MELFDIASELEISSYMNDRIADLIKIVITEVFDDCKGSEGDYFGKLMPYEHSFESVLLSAADIASEQQKKLYNMAEQLYKLSKLDKQPA